MAKTKTPIIKQDWLLALILSLVFLLFWQSAPIQGLERFAYDWGVRSSSSEAGDKVAVIAIDQTSINNLGRWPWPRDFHAQMIDLLAAAEAKAIGYTAFFSEPQLDPGFLVLQELKRSLEATSVFNPATNNADDETQAATSNDDGNQATVAEPSPEAIALENILRDVYSQVSDSVEILDVDKHLATSMRNADNVLLPMFFHIGTPQGNPDQLMPESIQAFSIENINDNIAAKAQGLLPLETFFIEPTLDLLVAPAKGIGHLNAYPDIDGGIRSEPLLLSYYDQYYPSLSLLLAAKSLNLSVADIQINLGEGIQLGRLNIGTDSNLQMQTFFYADQGDEPAFQIDSFYDVITGNIDAAKYKDKIVLIGATAAGLGTRQVTPIDPTMSPVLILAHTVASILNEDFYTSPAWSQYVTLGAFLLVVLFLMLLLPRMKARGGAIITLVMLLAFIATHYVLMTTQLIWVTLMAPAALLVIGYTLLTTKRFLVTERGKLHSDMESSESNRMLGLAFQGQGQLDMAFEKFRKCPKDEQIAEPLYNLALDYERKRQFAKAGNVYKYIAEFMPAFKDVKQRIERSQKMEDTVVLGGGGGTAAAGTLILEGGGVEKPMLGRYEVEKELGKGAMGIVYLGRDPKISRVVAIKTMALSQEFEADELEEVKERFFREAETAGRLNHPHIVTIYDAGEEHDLAYIAMEFLKGKDLADKTKKDSLLPLTTVIDITAKCADALSYAHAQSVVHRDIKPANIMFHQESGELKITDFGIARITDANKTKTGMVLGTPSYMSPEQLAGKRVDGRSDLFSLAVMFYQMTTGQLPFQAESMATLMYKIANDPQPSIMEIDPSLPPQLELFIAQAMEKNPDDRFQTGEEMAVALRNLAQHIPQ